MKAEDIQSQKARALPDTVNSPRHVRVLARAAPAQIRCADDQIILT